MHVTHGDVFYNFFIYTYSLSNIFVKYKLQISEK